MKRFIPLILIILSFYACNQVEESIKPTLESTISNDQEFEYPDIAIAPLDDRDAFTGRQVFDLALRYGGGDIGNFHWSMTDDFELWSAVVSADSTIILGYKPADAGDTWEELGDINLAAPHWQQAKAYTLGFIVDQLNAQFPDQNFTEEDLQIEEPGTIPVLYLKLSSYEVMAKLRQLETVRYVEPDGYEPEAYMEEFLTRSGCGGHSPYELNSGLLHNFSSTYNNSKVSWHLKAANIDDAWSVSQGDNIDIGLLDTGIEFDQKMLKNPDFIWGPSSGRFISSTHTYKGVFNNQNDSDDRCGHGTNRAGLLVGPVNNDGAITGAAYKANLRSVRVSNDVFINTSKTRKAFVDGLNYLVGFSNVKVINISLGRLTDKSDVKDAMSHATWTKGRMVVCSAGTISGVYPAKYSSAVAVTAVNYRPNSDPNGTSLIVNDNNANGSFVDFSAYIQDVQSVSGKEIWAYGLQKVSVVPRYSRGTSTAAPVVAGIAALVWSARPSLTRSQVWTILRNAASYSSKSSQVGYGVIDAKAAVDAAVAFGNAPSPITVGINGTSFISASSSHTWTASVTGASGSKSYKWYWNGGLVSTSSTYTRYVVANGSFSSNSLKLEVTTTSGQSGNTTRSITVL